MKHLFTLILLITLGTTTAWGSEATDQLLQLYQEQGAGPFSTEAGKAIWYGTHANPDAPKNRSCTDCHGQTLAEGGTHLRTGKAIAPMSPAITPERLTEQKKIRKWLLRNCKWTLGRECSWQERGDLLTFLQQTR